MIAAFGSADNRLRAGLSGGHVSVATRRSGSHAQSEAFEAALLLHQQGRLREAEGLYRTVLRSAPDHLGSLHHLGVIKAEQGNFNEAIRLIRMVVERQPQSAEIHNDLGVALERARRPAAATAAYERALALRPDFTEASFNLGNALQALGRHGEAIARFERTLALQPSHVEAITNLGISLHALHRVEEAIVRFQQALSLSPWHAQARYNLGTSLMKLERYDEAILQFERALSDRPGYAEAHNNLGTVLLELGRPSAAVVQFKAALAAKPNYPEAHNNLGNAWLFANRPEDAVAHYRRAIAAKPDYADAHSNLGLALKALGMTKQAVERCKRAVALDPQNAKALSNLGIAYDAAGNLVAAAASHGRALELDPSAGDARSALVMLKRRMCDWSNLSDEERSLVTAFDRGAKGVTPFVALISLDDPAFQLRCATRYAKDLKQQVSTARWRGGTYSHPKPRIGYLSAHFRTHATSTLMIELGELHNRARFEVYAFSIGSDDGTAFRKRLEQSFDRFFDVQREPDLEVVRQIRALEIDLLVDLTGYTSDHRIGILGHRPAPIQVNYLGYPGTMGADFIDYIVVDPFVVPPDKQRNFSEQLVYLPDAYQANDRKRRIADRTPTRAECNLPEQGFVFACFNTSHRLTPPLFDVWMRLLRATPDSVLWLLGDNDLAIANLRNEAQVRSISPSRVIFAPRCPNEDHLARLKLANLFLDTLPYNAHTTASDALWAGLPVLTCAGSSFAARVSGSLLHAVGLPELVTLTLEEYERLALKLAREPGILDSLRSRLAENRLSAPLFDSERYCRHLEGAYERMYERWQRGEPPETFTVPGMAR